MQQRRCDTMEFSPDGTHLWTGTKWVPVNPSKTSQAHQRIDTNQVSAEHVRQIGNLADVMIDKLNRGDMASAKDCWNQAKMIDLNTTKKVFDVLKAREISDAYLNLADFHLHSFRQLYDNPMFGIEFKVQVQMAPNQIELALNNSTTFGIYLDTFKYNLLYAKMWLYCNKFDAIWDRNTSKERFYYYLELAEKNTSSRHDLVKISELQDLFEQYEEERKSNESSEMVKAVGIFIFGILFLLFVLNL